MLNNKASNKIEPICDDSNKFINESLDGVLLVAGFIKHSNLIDVIDNLMPKRANQANLTYGEHIAILIIHYSNSQAKGLSNIKEHAQALNFAYLLDRPNISPDIFDDNYRFAVAQVLDDIHQFGCSKLFSNVVQQVMLQCALLNQQSINIVSVDATNYPYTGSERGGYTVNEDLDSDNFQFKDQAQTVKLTRGHSKSHRDEDNQITAISAVDANTGIAIFHKNLDGNYSDKKSFPQAFRYIIDTFNKMYTEMEYIVSDCAGCTEEGFAAFQNTHINYVTRIPNNRTLAQELIDDFINNKLPSNDFELFYSPSPKSKEKYPLHGKIYKGYSLYDREITTGVYLNPNRLNIDNKIRKLQKEIDKVQVQARKVKAKCKADAEIQYQKLVKDNPHYTFKILDIDEVYKNNRRGKPSANTNKVLVEVRYNIEVTINKEAVKKDAIKSSCFVLCTTDIQNNLDTYALLKLYRSNSVMEHFWKRVKDGVSQVEQIFVRKPERIEALNTICALTGSIMAACEYHIRACFEQTDMMIINSLGEIETQPTFEATKKFINRFYMVYDANSNKCHQNYRFTTRKKTLQQIPEIYLKHPDIWLQDLFSVLGSGWDFLTKEGLKRLKLTRRRTSKLNC